MSSYTPPFDAFAYSFAPLHAPCSAQRPPLAACSRECSGGYKSSIGTAFDTAASTGEAAHTLPALKELVLEYVHSLMSKYHTLRDSRRQQDGAYDRGSRHLLLQQELALLHEIIDLQHDMQELQRQHAGSDVVMRSRQAIWTALMSLRRPHVECHIYQQPMTFSCANSTVLRRTDSPPVKYVKGINTQRHS